MAILVKSMKMPTRCWDCPFYEIGHDESYCSLTQKDVARWTPTPRPDDCPLIDIGEFAGQVSFVDKINDNGKIEVAKTIFVKEMPRQGRWIIIDGKIVCSECYEPNLETNYCPHCGAIMNEVEK